MADRDFPTSGMDYVRAAIIQAMAEDLTLTDVFNCAEHAAGPVAFADAVNILATMKEGQE